MKGLVVDDNAVGEVSSAEGLVVRGLVDGLAEDGLNVGIAVGRKEGRNEG